MGLLIPGPAPDGGATSAARSAEEIVDVVRRLPLIDHHCHGVVTTDLDRAGFERLISEGGQAPDGLTNFDTPIGLAIRRHCAPVLGLRPHAPPATYLARRAELGVGEVTRRLLATTGTARYVVDTGFLSEALTTPGELAEVAGAVGHEIVRLESVAEQVAASGASAGRFVGAIADALERAVQDRRAVGVKTVAAYRVGLDLDPARPGPVEVAHAAQAWFAAGPGPRPGDRPRWRLTDPVLTRALLWAAVDIGLPIQVHVGFGDADIRMHRVDPSLLTDWLARHRVPVMLLHCWPFHRTAAFLAAVHPHVHLDLGLALHYLGPARATAVLAEAAEVAPFGKLLYSSDAFGVPELYHLAALAFRTGCADLLARRVADGEWSVADAVRIAEMIAHGNAARVYRLDPIAAVPTRPAGEQR
ncbi:MAG TPA: amidohydrolase family protein [Kineosporiaceae bacterium]